MPLRLSVPQMYFRKRFYCPVGEEIAGGKKAKQPTIFVRCGSDKKKFLLIIPVKDLGIGKCASVTISGSYTKHSCPEIISGISIIFSYYFF
jgi:hypothetical protein